MSDKVPEVFDLIISSDAPIVELRYCVKELSVKFPEQIDNPDLIARMTTGVTL